MPTRSLLSPKACFRRGLSLLSLLLLSLLLQACGDDAPTAQERLAEQLEENRAKWQNLNPHNYSFEMRWRCHCSEISAQWALVTVRSDTVAQAMDVETQRIYGDTDRKEYLSIDQLFEVIEEAQGAKEVIAVFSPTYGMPTNVAIDYRDNYGDEKSFETRKLTIN